MLLPTDQFYPPGGEKNNKLNNLFSSSEDDERQVGLAAAERLQDIIDSLTEQRAALLRRVNAEKSTTKNLPIEVLATIFRYACRRIDFIDTCTKAGDGYRGVDHDFPVSPLDLGAVSFHWRNVVESTPHLWTSVYVAVNNGNVIKVVSLLRRYLGNSKKLGCTVEVDIEEQTKINSHIRNCPTSMYFDDTEYLPWSNDRELPIEPVRQVIFNELPEQIKSLRLVSPPPEWFDSAERVFGERFTRLEALHISWENMPFGEGCDRVGIMPRFDIDVESVPGLQRVWMRNIPKLSWRRYNIVEFHLSLIDYNTCVALLALCPHLLSCSMVSPSTEFHRGFGALRKGMTCKLPLLQVLEWSFPLKCPNSYNLFDILPALSLPSIKTLSLHNIFDGFDCTPTPGLERFFDHLPQSCHSLHLSTDAHFEDNSLPRITECIQHIPATIANTSFRSLCAGFAKFIYMNGPTHSSAIKTLSKFAISPQDERFQNPIETCSTWSPDCDKPEFLPSEFLKAMKSRLSLQGSLHKFRFEYVDMYCRIEWGLEVQQSLKKLVQSGLDLDILENGRRVDWLRG